LPPPGKRVADFATDISVDDYLVGKSSALFFLFFLICWYVAGSDEGQLVVVPPAAVIAVAAVVPRAKGSALSAGGEIPALTAVRDEAGAVSRRLKEMKEALSQVRLS
jgi:predicted phage tail protein